MAVINSCRNYLCRNNIFHAQNAETKEYRLLKAALTLILAGAVGNVIDRVIRGYVVDFFEFTFISFPVFNMADIYVVVGAIAMALIMIFVIKDEDKTGNGGN